MIEVKIELEGSATVQLFSSLKRQGLNEAREVMEKFLSHNTELI